MNQFAQFLSRTLNTDKPYRDLALSLVIGVSAAYGLVVALS